jgi:hypothetical protein
VHPRNNCPAHVSRRAESGVTNSAYVYAAHAHVGYVAIDMWSYFSSSAIIPPPKPWNMQCAFLGEEKKMDTRGGWLGRRRVWECAGWVKRDGRGSGGGVCVMGGGGGMHIRPRCKVMRGEVKKAVTDPLLTTPPSYVGGSADPQEDAPFRSICRCSRSVGTNPQVPLSPSLLQGCTVQGFL